MKKIQITVIILSCILTAGLNTEVNYLQKGKKYFEMRYRDARNLTADQKYIGKAIDYFEEALKNGKDSISASVWLMRSYDFKAGWTDIPGKRKKRIYRKGVELGRKMKEKYPNHVGIRYWYMANLGRWSQTVGVVKAARNEAASEIRNLALEIIEEAPAYDEAGAYRILGGMHLKLPEIPFLLSWPSDEKAVDLLKRATQLAPESVANKVLYAQALEDEGNKSRAIKVLEHVISREPRPQNYLPDKYYIQMAGELLQEYRQG